MWMAPRTDRTARIPSGVASWVTTNHAAKGSVFCQLKKGRQLKIGPNSSVQVKAWEGAGSGGVRGMHVQGDHVVAAGLHGTVTCWDVHVGAQVAAGSLFVVSLSRCRFFVRGFSRARGYKGRARAKREHPQKIFRAFT